PFVASYCDRANCHLHSFPTRRSSDLGTRPRPLGVPTSRPDHGRRRRTRPVPPSPLLERPARPRRHVSGGWIRRGGPRLGLARQRDRKSTRLNSSHVKISYAVFCLKKN